MNLFDNSMSMEGGGMITGTWQNTKTGDIVTVRDSYIDGEDMVIVLTNGRQLTMDQFSDYVQVDTTSQDLINMEKNKKENARQKLLFDGMGEAPKAHAQPTPTKQLLAQLGDDSLMEVEPVKQEDNTKENIEANMPKTKNDVSEAVDMVMKVLDKSPEPEIIVKVDWPDFPNDAVNTLKQFFNVTDKDIVDAVVAKYCKIEALRDAIEQWFGK